MSLSVLDRDLLAQLEGILQDPQYVAETLGGPEGVERFRENGRTLEGLGFQLLLSEDSVRILHMGRDFNVRLPLGTAALDHREMSRLFQRLRDCFGRFGERVLPWFFEAGPNVTVPYSVMKDLILATDRVLRSRCADAPEDAGSRPADGSSPIN